MQFKIGLLLTEEGHKYVAYKDSFWPWKRRYLADTCIEDKGLLLVPLGNSTLRKFEDISSLIEEVKRLFGSVATVEPTLLRSF